MSGNIEWVSEFARVAGKRGLKERLLHFLFSKLLKGSKNNRERIEFYAVLLAAEVKYAEEIFEAKYPYATEDEYKLAPLDAAETVLEHLGTTLHKLLGDTLVVAFRYKKPPPPSGDDEKPFTIYGGCDL
jgi:hypothetical protein